jgi:ATP phosphoribosyltransferase
LRHFFKFIKTQEIMETEEAIGFETAAFMTPHKNFPCLMAGGPLLTPPRRSAAGQNPMPEANEKTLKLAIPKGSLQEPTLELLAKAGYEIYVSSRGYRPSSNDSDLDLFLIRAQEVGRYIDQGFIDCGITGYDWASEYGENLVDMAELPYSRATARPTRWVLVVPEDSPITKPEHLEGKRIATEGVGITKKYLAEKGINAEVEFSWGATEVKVPDLVDAIVDVTETGSSIKANKLRIVDTLLTSFPHFYASKAAYADEWKRQKMERIVLLLNAALQARDKVGLKMNLPSDKLAELLQSLPSLRRPTVSPLAEDGWVAVETVIDEKIVRDLIPTLKELGAEGIIEYPLNKIVA